MNRIKYLLSWSPAAGAILAAIAIGNAVIQVGKIPAKMWADCCQPEPGCPSPFPGICEDS